MPGAKLADLYPKTTYIDGVDQASFLVADDGLSARRSRPYTLNQYFAAIRVDEFKDVWTAELENAVVQRGDWGGFSGSHIHGQRRRSGKANAIEGQAFKKTTADRLHDPPLHNVGLLNAPGDDGFHQRQLTRMIGPYMTSALSAKTESPRLTSTRPGYASRLRCGSYFESTFLR